MGTPCHNCERRAVGCHGSCEDYKAWKEDREKYLAARYAEVQAAPDVYRAITRHMRNQHKPKG